jgi:hypothetical protein
MRYIVTVRGMLKSADEEESQKTHDATVEKVSPLGKSMGSTGHQAYLNPQNRREFLAIDFWDNLEGIQKLYSDPNLATEFGKLFEGQPEVVIWADSGWFQY